MIRCLAIDDEKLALDLLEDNISRVPFLQMIGRCRNAMEALDIINKQPIDLIFLDIQMPGVSGLQFLKTLSNKPMAIMITAYDKYALDGFDLDVVDYLVKPVAFDRFLKACNKAYDIFQLKNPSSLPDRNYFFVNVEYNHVRINYDDILYIEGMKDYIKIHLAGSTKPVITRMSMKSMEERLPGAEFVRIHKSFIVAINKITAIKRGLLIIHNAELPVSDSFKTSLEQRLGIQPE
ncbi:MAG: DNA-binding response regulator [Chitinophagaceae bacterium]|nr:DNA-binding response regulator [Chitinophagaceae bacterium]